MYVNWNQISIFSNSDLDIWPFDPICNPTPDLPLSYLQTNFQTNPSALSEVIIRKPPRIDTRTDRLTSTDTIVPSGNRQGTNKHVLYTVITVGSSAVHWFNCSNQNFYLQHSILFTWTRPRLSRPFLRSWMYLSTGSTWLNTFSTSSADIILGNLLFWRVLRAGMLNVPQNIYIVLYMSHWEINSSPKNSFSH
jgi:hypothetical protein